VIRIPETIYQIMLDHAHKGFPNEACGILAGKGAAQGDKTVSDFFPMRNLDESSISYFMDPKEQLAVFKKMREHGVEMTGIFHSHVASQAYPSQKDVRLAFYPEVSYLIVSLSEKGHPVLKSFHIQDEVVKEEEVRID